MKKLDFSLGDGREMLTRDQMKAVTGGLYPSSISCFFAMSNGDVWEYQCGSGINMSDCRSGAAHNIGAIERATGSHYVGGSMTCSVN